MRKTICVWGGDPRQKAAARALRDHGCTVLGPGQAALADCLLLPLPADDAPPQLRAMLAAARPGTLVLAGRPGPAVAQAARAAGLPLADYFQRPELAALNAVPTAEGCIGLLLRLRSRTLWQSPVMVISGAASCMARQSMAMGLV